MHACMHRVWTLYAQFMQEQAQGESYVCMHAQCMSQLRHPLVVAVVVRHAELSQLLKLRTEGPEIFVALKIGWSAALNLTLVQQ